MPRPPYVWTDEQPLRTSDFDVRLLRPLERVGSYRSAPIANQADVPPPVGEFFDKQTHAWIVCSLREYLRSIGWVR